MPSPQRRGLRQPVDLPPDAADAYLGVTEAEREEAHRLTRAIKRSGEEFFRLVAEAHAKKVHAVFGYGTWAAYVETELGFTRQYADNLIKAASTITAIQNASGIPVALTERMARGLRAVLPEVLERMTMLIEGGGDPHLVVEHVIDIYGRPNRKQAEAMAAVPGAATAMTLQLLEARGGQFAKDAQGGCSEAARGAEPPASHDAGSGTRRGAVTPHIG